MADKENRSDARDEGNSPGQPDGDDIKLPSAGGSLPPAMVHRDSHSPMTKAE